MNEKIKEPRLYLCIGVIIVGLFPWMEIITFIVAKGSAAKAKVATSAVAGAAGANVDVESEANIKIGFCLLLICFVGIAVMTLIKDFSISKETISQQGIKNTLTSMAGDLTDKVSTLASENNILSNMTMNTCPKCGASVIKGKKLCAKCGTKVDISQDEESKKKKSPLVIVILLVICMVVAISIVLCKNQDKNKSKEKSTNESVTTEDTTTESTTEQTTEPTTQEVTTAKVFDADKYVGTWYSEGCVGNLVSESGGMKLDILSIIDNVEANIIDGKAEFAFENDGWGNAGYGYMEIFGHKVDVY